MLQAAKVTWTEDGKAEISENKHPIKGCQMNDLFLISMDKNETLLILDSLDTNASNLCSL
ncbi:MAG: Unknown protein [uncultured Sulfurovum sp.]|uniref:Uncharacterized protein n=1 Tax=uncultured Sulfurovum sp. TaxID=269237 RepID=A0A6S6SY66_9BACT|nr:MAG: Unknown protein [uncultured Sulfurovum sp.]